MQAAGKLTGTRMLEDVTKTTRFRLRALVCCSKAHAPLIVYVRFDGPIARRNEGTHTGKEMEPTRVTALLAFLLIMPASVQAVTCAPPNSPDANVGSLTVEPRSHQVFLDEDKHRGIASLGTLKNAGGACFRNILLEANYFDPKGNLVDSVTRRLGTTFVPPKEEVTFRLIGDATRPAESYARQSIRVVAADADGSAARVDSSSENRPPQPKSLGTVVFEFFTAFGPVFLLIFIWWYVTYRSRKYSIVAQVQRQTELLGGLCTSLDRIAAAVERNDSRATRA
jgi:hypothetical protein